jgi:hypothetical protein
MTTETRTAPCWLASFSAAEGNSVAVSRLPEATAFPAATPKEAGHLSAVLSLTAPALGETTAEALSAWYCPPLPNCDRCGNRGRLPCEACRGKGYNVCPTCDHEGDCHACRCAGTVGCSCGRLRSCPELADQRPGNFRGVLIDRNLLRPLTYLDGPCACEGDEKGLIFRGQGWLVVIAALTRPQCETATVEDYQG